MRSPAEPFGMRPPSLRNGAGFQSIIAATCTPEPLAIASGNRRNPERESRSPR